MEVISARAVGQDLKVVGGECYGLLMRIGSLFSGIGGLELGLERAGLGHTAWQVEIDPFCRAVLAKHWPEAKRYEDITRVSGSDLGPVDVICGGFPCQDISSAGKGAGLSGARSGLWYQYLRLIGELKPKFVVIENVGSGARRWVDFVRSDLARAGYSSVPIPLSAFDVGAPHLRERIFIVAYLNSFSLRQQRGRVEREGGQDPLQSEWAGEAGLALAPDPEGGRWTPGQSECITDDSAPGSGRAGDVGGVHPGTPSAALAPDSDRARLGFGRAGGTEAANDPSASSGEIRASGNTDSDSESADAIDEQVAMLRGLASDSSPWAFAPEFRGMDDGVSVRLDRTAPRSKRLKALGNAVVPQCAEVVGYVIRQLAGL